MPEKVRTENIPPEYQAIVLAAIAEAQERRQQLIASGQLKDVKKILKEAYTKLLERMHQAGVPEDEFIPEHHFYMASGLGRIVSWALNYASEYPPTHRKGYGESYLEEIDTPKAIIFMYGGGGTGGPGQGPGDEEWPDPAEMPEGSFIPELSKNYYGFLADSWSAMDIDRLQREALAYGGTDAVTNLHGTWLLQAARELAARGEPIGLEYYHNPIPGPPIPGTGDIGNYFSPDILLINDNGYLYSVDVIAGTDRTWTQGKPSWQVPGYQNQYVLSNDWRDVP